MEVPVLFYGGLIHPAIQERVGLNPHGTRRAILRDYRIAFEPWVNLHQAPFRRVHGLIMDVSHEQLEKIYSSLAARYFPVPVICDLVDGAQEPALCYIAPRMDPGPIDPPHVHALLDGAKLWQFPADYIEDVRAFLPR